MATTKRERKKTAPAEERKSFAIEREPYLPAPTALDKVAHVRAVVAELYQGQFRQPSLLADQMFQNPRFRVALSTRLAGLTGAEVRWRPSQNNRDGRAAAKAMEEDWRRIAPTAAREQFNSWGLLLGSSFAQPAWFTDQSTMRQIPHLRVWHPYSCQWWDTDQAYRVQPYGTEAVKVKSPAITDDLDLTDGWIVHEPFGPNGWRRGYLISCWYSWLGHELARRDALRVAEKVGQGIALADIPNTADTKAAADFRNGVRNMGSGGVVPCEELEDGRKFNLRPFEWNASNGAAVVDSVMAAMAIDIIILFLGGNLQTEVKGGGSYAAVSGQAEVRADYLAADAEAENDTLHRQAFRPWAEANFGDPDLAPIREVVSDPPGKDQAAAQVAVSVSQAIDSLARNGVDIPQLLERFRLPLSAAGITQVVVPDMPAPPIAPEAQPDDEPAQGNAPE